MFLADEAQMPALRVLRWLCPAGHSQHERLVLTPPERAVEPKWGREVTAERKRINSRDRTQRMRRLRLSAGTVDGQTARGGSMP